MASIEREDASNPSASSFNGDLLLPSEDRTRARLATFTPISNIGSERAHQWRWKQISKSGGKGGAAREIEIEFREREKKMGVANVIRKNIGLLGAIWLMSIEGGNEHGLQIPCLVGGFSLFTLEKIFPGHTLINTSGAFQTH